MFQFQNLPYRKRRNQYSFLMKNIDLVLGHVYFLISKSIQRSICQLHIMSPLIKLKKTTKNRQANTLFLMVQLAAYACVVLLLYPMSLHQAQHASSLLFIPVCLNTSLDVFLDLILQQKHINTIHSTHAEHTWCGRKGKHCVESFSHGVCYISHPSHPLATCFMTEMLAVVPG